MSITTKPTPAILAHDHSLVAMHGTILTTRNGFAFKVRPVEQTDKDALAAFFTYVSAKDIRFRFLSSMRTVSDDTLNLMINVDHKRKEDYLAFDIDDKTIIASAMLVADERGETAEVALVIRSDYKHRGMSWSFLEYIIGQAKQNGIKKLQSIESRQHHEAIEMEREMGWKATSYPGDASLMLLEYNMAEAEAAL